MMLEVNVNLVVAGARWCHARRHMVWYIQAIDQGP